MPEKSVSRGKYNFNKYQKEKQNKILQYYRRSFKSQLAPVREITRPRRTRKQHFQTNPSTIGKLTKTHTLERDMEKEHEKEKKINLEKTQITDITTKSSTQKGGEHQYVIMD